MMAMSRVERHLKMMNDIAKCKTPKAAKQFKIEVLTDYIQKPLSGMSEAEIEMFRQELERLKQED